MFGFLSHQSIWKYSSALAITCSSNNSFWPAHHHFCLSQVNHHSLTVLSNNSFHFQNISHKFFIVSLIKTKSCECKISFFKSSLVPTLTTLIQLQITIETILTVGEHRLSKEIPPINQTQYWLSSLLLQRDSIPLLSFLWYNLLPQ